MHRPQPHTEVFLEGAARLRAVAPAEAVDGSRRHHGLAPKAQLGPFKRSFFLFVLGGGR